MNIAVFHEVVSGGARRGANEFARTLKEKGHIVDLYITDKVLEENEKNYYTNVYLYPFVAKRWKGKNWKIKLYKDTIELYLLYKLHKLIAADMTSKSYDFVFIHPSRYTQSPFLLRFLYLPKMYYCQEPLRMIYEKELDKTHELSFFKKYYERINRKIRKYVDIKNIRSADIILANSTFTQGNILQAYNLKSIVCHMGVDLKRFFSKNLKRDIDILFIGSKDSIDGYDLFEDTKKFFKEKHSIEYLLRGEKWLSDDKELNTFYNRAKIVICFGRKEPFGLIPLEAMAAGVVVIALDEGGYKDSVIQGKTGIRVSKNPKEIAYEIENLLKDTKRLTQYSENAKNSIQKKWSWEKATQNVLDSFNVWQKK